MSNNALIFGTQSAGKFFKSLDSGGTYTYLSSVPDKGISSIVSQDNRSILCSTLVNVGDKGKIYKSVDNGSSWYSVFTSSTSINIYDICVFKGSGGIALATEEQGGSIYKTTNYGETWSLAYDTGQAYAYNLCCFDNGTVIVGTGTTGRVYRSTDFGDNWSQVHDDSASFIYGGAVFDNGVVLLGTSNCSILRSSNYGSSFSQVADFGSLRIRSIRSLDNGSGIALASTFYGDSFVYRTVDFGANWSMVLNDASSSGFEDLLIDTDGLALAGGSNGLIHSSSDFGANWSPTPYDSGESIVTSFLNLEEPVITSCSVDPISQGIEVTLGGSVFLSSGAIVELTDGPDYETSTKIQQVEGVQTDTSIVVTVDVGDFIDTGYFWITNSFGSRTSFGYEVGIASYPEITTVNPSIFRNGDQIKISGENFSFSGIVELVDNADYDIANKYALYIDYYSDTEIYVTVDNGGWYGPGYIYVTNESARRNEVGYSVTINSPLDPLVFVGEKCGHGHQPFGRHCFGGMKTDVEPRFIDSNPGDGETGVSVLFVSAKTSIYCFSSRIQSVRVEISEDGGEYVDAYVNELFVSPYNGSDSYIDFQQSDPQKMTIQIEKTIPWYENIEIMIRVTATDQFGNEATDELPIIW